MFAVIKTGGKQYKVAAEDVLRIEKLDAEAGATITFDQVLMVGSDDGATVGTPLVAGALVTAELVEQIRDKKIVVFKKKRRKNYRRKAGHRQELSVVRIGEILTGGAKPKPAAKPAPGEKSTAETPAAKPAAEAESSPAIVDDIKLISGVGPALEKKLNGLGITSLKQIAAFSPEEIERVDGELSFKGRIDREEWVTQAKYLLEGKPPRAKSAEKPTS
jgi:large subunit ribosomal protein L21